jgi:hypothetical protein
MDESSSDAYPETKNRNFEVLMFAWLMLAAAVIMGILYATKKCPECGPDYNCWERLKKLEKLAEAVQSCENQDWEENQSVTALYLNR